MDLAENLVFLCAADPPAIADLRAAAEAGRLLRCSGTVIVPLGSEYPSVDDGLTATSRHILTNVAVADTFSRGAAIRVAPAALVERSTTSMLEAVVAELCEAGTPATCEGGTRGSGRSTVIVLADGLPELYESRCSGQTGYLPLRDHVASVAAAACKSHGATACTVRSLRDVLSTAAAPTASSSRHISPSVGGGSQAHIYAVLTAQAGQREASLTRLYGAVPPSVLSAAQRYGLYGLGLPGSDRWRGISGWYTDTQGVSEAPAAIPVPAACGPPYHVAVLGGSFNPVTSAHLAVATGLLHSRFSPPLPHRDGTAAADNADADGADSVGVSEVWVVPCGARPDKASTSTATPLQRYITTLIAVEATCPPHVPVRVMPLEVWEPVALASYTLLTRLQRAPGAPATSGASFSLVIGADLVPTLTSWRHAEALLREVSFSVVPRPGWEPPAASAPSAAASNGSSSSGGSSHTGLPQHIRYLQPGTEMTEPIQLSSTEVRSRIAAGASACASAAVATSGGAGTIASSRPSDPYAAVEGLLPLPALSYIAAEQLYM